MATVKELRELSKEELLARLNRLGEAREGGGGEGGEEGPAVRLDRLRAELEGFEFQSPEVRAAYLGTEH